MVHVGAAVIASGPTVLVARRSDSSTEIWEFPGGKVEPGETVQACVVREIAEELGVRVQVGTVIDEFACAAGGSRIFFSFCWARVSSGTLELRVHDDFRWLEPAELDRVPMHEADRRIASRLQVMGISAEIDS
jgi:8-oxo-dGTP diphosphatase